MKLMIPCQVLLWMNKGQKKKKKEWEGKDSEREKNESAQMSAENE